MSFSRVIDIRTIHLWHITCTGCGTSAPETAAGLDAAFELARAEGWECDRSSQVAFCSIGCAEAWGRRRADASFLAHWAGRARHAETATR
jgi:hypothetical protein